MSAPRLALGIVLLMVLLVGLGWLSMLKGALLAAGLMILTRCTRGQVARRSPDWQVLVVIATSFGIGAALQQSGAALFVAQGADGGWRGGEAPGWHWRWCLGVTALLTALATDNVPAVLMFPIALAAAQQLGVSLLPFAHYHHGGGLRLLRHPDRLSDQPDGLQCRRLSLSGLPADRIAADPVGGAGDALAGAAGVAVLITFCVPW